MDINNINQKSNNSEKFYCIYRIQNLINNHTYIGKHLYKNQEDPLFRYWGSGIILKEAYRKYGKENFKKEVVIKNITSKEEINKLEKYYISMEKENGHSEYNISPGGDGGIIWKKDDSTPHPSKGKKLYFKDGVYFFVDESKGIPEGAIKKKRPHTEETKEKLRKLHLGKKYSDEINKKKGLKGEKNYFYNKHLTGALNGRYHNEEASRKVSEKLKGRKSSEETKRKISENHANVNGKNNPAYGRHWYNNGITQVFTYECPKDFSLGKLSK